MIKINRHTDLLDKLKSNHLKYFEETKPNRKNPTDKSQTYKEILQDIPVSFSIEEKKFLEFIGKYYRSFLTGSPYELELLRKRIVNNFSESLHNTVSDKNSPIHKRLQKIFNYDSFISRVAHNWGAYRLTIELDVNVCPYCNRQFITTYHSDSGKTRPALDHFYDKVTYPYFAISLFNLIPCCSVCNSSFKGKSKFTVSDNIHPYIEDFNKTLVFSAGFEFIDVAQGEQVDIDSFLGADKNFSIKLIESEQIASDRLGILRHKARKGKNNADAFKLEAIYDNHKDYVRDLIKKAIYYNEARLKDIENSHKGLFNGREEVLSWVLGLDPHIDDFEKRILSKFIFDIANELGITRYIK